MKNVSTLTAEDLTAALAATAVIAVSAGYMTDTTGMDRILTVGLTGLAALLIFLLVARTL